MTGVLLSRERFADRDTEETHRQREESHVKMGAEIRMLQLQAKE